MSTELAGLTTLEEFDFPGKYGPDTVTVSFDEAKRLIWLEKGWKKQSFKCSSPGPVFVTRFQYSYLFIPVHGEGFVIYNLSDDNFRFYEYGDFWSCAFGYNPKTRTAILDGCWWACPYSWCFWDMDDPMNAVEIAQLDDAKEEIKEINGETFLKSKFLTRLSDGDIGYERDANGKWIPTENGKTYKLNPLGWWEEWNT